MAMPTLARSSRARLPLLLVLSLITVTCQSGSAPTGVQTPPPTTPPPPPPPPGPDRIAFDMQKSAGGPRNIWVVAIDGTGLVQLTSDSADHHGPTLHDSLLAFGSVRVNGSIIASLQMGGGPSLAVFGPGDEPALSPDGTMYAYLAGGGGTPLVWIAHLDGTQAQRFAPAAAGWSGASEEHPVWSPSGDRIAYVSTRSTNASIYVGVVGGAPGSATLLAGSATGASVEPAWSPDGAQIVFTSNRDGPSDLYVVIVATGAVTRLTNLGNVGQPAWLPGGHIVFTQWTGGVAGLEWLDPSAPKVLHSLTTGGDAQHAAAFS